MIYSNPKKQKYNNIIIIIIIIVIIIIISSKFREMLSCFGMTIYCISLGRFVSAIPDTEEVQSQPVQRGRRSVGFTDEFSSTDLEVSSSSYGVPQNTEYLWSMMINDSLLMMVNDNMEVSINMEIPKNAGWFLFVKIPSATPAMAL